MKTASVGFEIGFSTSLNTCSASSVIIPAIILRAYQFDLSMRPMGGTYTPSQWATDVLFQARLGQQAANTDLGPFEYSKSVSGYNSEAALFCSAILKTWGTEPVNKVITLTGLNIPVPANTPLLFNAVTSGTAFDFEVAGTLHYDLQ